LGVVERLGNMNFGVYMWLWNDCGICGGCLPV